MSSVEFFIADNIPVRPASVYEDPNGRQGETEGVIRNIAQKAQFIVERNAILPDPDAHVGIPFHTTTGAEPTNSPPAATPDEASSPPEITHEAGQNMQQTIARNNAAIQKWQRRLLFTMWLQATANVIPRKKRGRRGKNRRSGKGHTHAQSGTYVPPHKRG